MFDIGILGTGKMGSAFAKAFAKRGKRVGVWNRTLEKAQDIAGDNIIVCETPAELFKQSPVVYSFLGDYSNLTPCLTDLHDLDNDGTLVNFSSGSAAEAYELRDILNSSWGYLDGANFCIPQQVGADEGILCLAGPDELWEQVRDDLAAVVASASLISSTDIGIPNKIDAGYVGIYEIPMLIAFSEMLSFYLDNDVPEDTIQKMIEFSANNTPSILSELFQEIRAESRTEVASLETYAQAARSYLQTTGGEGSSHTIMLGAAVEYLERCAQDAHGPLSITAVASRHHGDTKQS